MSADEILKCTKLFYENLYMAVPCESLNNNLLSSLIKQSRTGRIRKATDQGGVF